MIEWWNGGATQLSLEYAQSGQQKGPSTPKLSTADRLKTPSSTRWISSSRVVPGLLVPLQHPLSIAVASPWLHLRHYFFEIDELGGAGRGATFLVRLLSRIANIYASGVLHLVDKSSQAFVRVSPQCLDLKQRATEGRQQQEVGCVSRNRPRQRLPTAVR